MPNPKPARGGRLAPRWRKVLRDVWQHKPRTLLVVLAIAIGILGAGAVLDTWLLLRSATRSEYQASNPAAATLRIDAVDLALLDRIRALPAIRDVQARRIANGSAQVQEGWRPVILFAADDFSAIRIGIVKPESGTWPPRDGEIIVEASSLEFSGTAVGESLLVEMTDAAPRRLAVAGVARDVGLAPGWMEHVVYGFATRATLEQLGATASVELQIVVAGKPMSREAVRRVANGVRDVVEGTGRTVTSVDVPVPGRHIHAAQIDSLLFTQGAFGVLAMILSGILVVNLIAAMLTGQVREIGVMKALGANSRQIAGLYLSLAFVLGLLACGIAIPAAALLGRAYANFTAGLLNFDLTGFRIPPAAFLVQVAVGVLLPVAAAAIPVVRGCRIPVAQALRDFGIDTTAGHSGGRFLQRTGGLSRPILLALRNAFRRRQRMALTLVALATGGAVYLGALDLRAAIRGSVGLLFDSNRFDLVVKFAHGWAPDSLESVVAAVPGVAHTEAWGAIRAAFREPDGRLGNTFAISAPPAATQRFAPSFRSGRWLGPGDGNALLVNRRLLADEPRLAPGDTLTLVIGGQPVLWRITGVVDTGPSPVAYTCRETLARITGTDRVDRVVIAATPGGPATRLDLIQRLRAHAEGRGMAVQTSQLMEPARRVMEDHLLMVAGFLGVMAQLMIVVGGLGLGSTMSLGVLERTREIGVLRALGARHGAILAMVQIEGLVVGILSWAIALPLSIPMSVVLGKAFGRIMFAVPVVYVPQWPAVLQWLGLVVAVSIVACAWPAFRATRIPTATALAYE